MALRMDVLENCEGTLEECLMSGWVNAMDTIDEGLISTDEEFRYMALEPAVNMYGTDWSTESDRLYEK